MSSLWGHARLVENIHYAVTSLRENGRGAGEHVHEPFCNKDGAICKDSNIHGVLCMTRRLHGGKGPPGGESLAPVQSSRLRRANSEW